MSSIRSIVAAFIAVLITTPLGIANSLNSIPLDAVPLVEIPELDWAAIFAEDARRSSKDEAPRYAIPHEVRITPKDDGIWERIDNLTMRWSLRVRSENAISLNLGFAQWKLPSTASMNISASDGSMSIRPFNSSDNKPHGELWTPVVQGDDLLIEILVSPRQQRAVNTGIVLTSINVGYRGFYEQGVDRSGSCNYDVVCAEGDDWWDEIPCVAVISTGGSTFCSGFMVNNTYQDRTPYFMTAYHCGVSSNSAPSLVTYWNYQNSYCRVPGSGDSGGPGDGQLNQFNTGATHLISGSSTDYTLVVMDDSPDDEWEISFCGWDATGYESPQGIGIHHPATDEKRISFEFEPTTTTSYLGTSIPGDGTHVRIEDWDLGTTEPGSSGSPVFNVDHQVIGQLHGGYASCTSQTSDWYGKFSVSYAAGLDQHLDAANTGALTLDTLPGTGLSVTPGEGTTHLCSYPCSSPTNEMVTYTLTNNSPASLSYTIAHSGSSFLEFLSSTFGTIPAGGTVPFTVQVKAGTFGIGVHNATITFHDTTNDQQVQRLHTLEIGQTEFDVTPEDHFFTGGPVGGPFDGTMLYTVSSTQPTAFDFKIDPNGTDWIDFNGIQGPFTGTLFGIGDSVEIEVSINENAHVLDAGLYEVDLSFIDLAEGDTETTRTVFHDVGRFSYTATDLPQAINDYLTTTSYIEVADAYCVGDVDIELDVTHTFIGDLIIEVTSPEGSIVRLHDRSGGSEDDIHAYYDEEGGDLPDGPGQLSDWVGEIVTGTWTLAVSDNAGLDQGSLDHWKLKIASSGEECPPLASDVVVFTDEYTPVEVTLIGASSDGGPIDYILTSVPSYGSLQNIDGTPIGGIPYTLDGNQVRYEPDLGFIGIDLFTYKVSDGVDSNEATVTIHVGELPYPDECETAQPVQNGTWEFSTLEATNSVDPYNDDQCSDSLLGVMSRDVWFRYEACASGSMTVSTCDIVDFDTDIVVYQGDCENMTQVACNGDTSGCSGYSSILTMEVYDGSSYLIRVGGWGANSMGGGNLLIDGPEGDCVIPCTGDINNDGSVAVSDLLLVIDQWGQAGGSADVNGDGIVDVSDLLAIVGNWGPCP